LFDGIGIKVFRANNVIIRNLKIRYVNTGDKDAITLEGPASNIWIDHNEIYNRLNVDKDFYDELISGKKDVDKVTISYNYLHDSWKTSLWGNNDSDNFNRRITFHHNYWQRVNSRLPLFRFGQGHIYNNYYTEVQESGINSRMGAVIRIENNVFENTTNPIVSFYSSALGYWDTRGNQFTNTSWQAMPAEGVIAGPNVQPNAVLNLPYSFNLLPTNQVKAHVIANAGVNKCSF
jgi:pectate lyase